MQNITIKVQVEFSIADIYSYMEQGNKTIPIEVPQSGFA